MVVKFELLVVVGDVVIVGVVVVVRIIFILLDFGFI